MQHIHPGTGFFITDDSVDPLAGALPSQEQLESSYRSMILSASGWRKIFAQGGEEDPSPGICRADLFLVALAAEAFWRQMKCSRVIIGMDSRPTGPAIADVVCRVLIAHGVQVSHQFISAAPEIMASSFYRNDDHFFYISASHNPIGHNGFKFGSRGGVADAQQATAVIATFRTLLTDPAASATVQKLSASLDAVRYRKVLQSIGTSKEEALVSYERLVLDTATDSEDELVFGSLVAAIRHDVATHPIGIVAELNGSARGLSIDKPFLEGLGVKTRFLNDKPRQIVHGIVPEQENLELCRQELDKAHREDPSFVIGYVPDNDGDRGNIVYFDETTNSARILGAQELFALVARIELTLSRKEGIPQAIAVNGPTSLMIETIAASLGAKVFRAEVGEANVVRLAQQLRGQGYAVRMLGEGSNGGNITHPSKVRDPLNTLVSLIKLLSSADRFARITKREGLPSIARALESLPARTITGGFSDEAVMRIKTTDHGKLKRAYEKQFLLSYLQRREELGSRFGIYGWRAQQTEGTNCKNGFGEAFRSPPMRGGLKIIFADRLGNDSDFIWMRGSGTEPVFRIMADASGNDRSRHDYLLAWQRSLVECADREAISGQ